MNATNATWIGENQRLLLSAIDELRVRIENRLLESEREILLNPGDPVLEPAPAFVRMRDGFGLSGFEIDLVLLCAGIELDAQVAELVQALNGGSGTRPTIGLALRILDSADWGAMTPAASLRRWRLIDVEPGATFEASPIRLDERTLHFLMGHDYLDPRISDLLRQVEFGTVQPDSYREQSERIRDAWGPIGGLLSLDSDDWTDARTIAALASAQLGLALHAISASAIATFSGERETLVRLWEREALMISSALLIEDDSAGNDSNLTAARDLVSRLQGPVIVPPPLMPGAYSRPVVSIRVEKLSASEQRSLWMHRIGPAAGSLNGRMDQLIAQFPMSADQIASAMQRLEKSSPDESLDTRLWDASRATVRAPMARFAQRIETDVTWDDLILPHDQLDQLHAIAIQVEHRSKVHDHWQLGRKSGRGLGISALFVGPSGTGKTLAAEVLANELRLDLYRIDLSQVVSKYIGETEKNLSAVFESAERGGAVLLFDEADALFGKRSEIKDSHDRYANIEISYLLQRMEAYVGLAILTTNQRASLDLAFLRRLRFVISFPFPDVNQRTEIWRHVFPPATPTEWLDYAQLARLNVTGGVIRNIALHAAFLAAASERPVGMAHLYQAAKSECLKIEKPVTAAEIGGWI